MRSTVISTSAPGCRGATQRASQLRSGARVLGGAHRGGRALGDGGEPHAVHDRTVEAGEPRRGEVGVQRVVVAADRGEGTHVGRRGHGEPVEPGAGGLLGVLGQRGRGGQLGGAGASAHHEALEEAGDEASSPLGVVQMRTSTLITWPAVVSTTPARVAEMCSSEVSVGSVPTVMRWSRWTRSSRPSTGPMQANTAGQARPTRASGTASAAGRRHRHPCGCARGR